MDWPDSFKCNGVRVYLDRDTFTKDNDVALGYFSTSSGRPTIQVCPGLRKDLEDNTIAHEIIHSWLFQTGVGEILTNETEELLCNSFASCLVDFVKSLR